MRKKKSPQTKATKKANPWISLRELARIAGVSPATVSLAMKHSPRLSRETKDRIRQLAKKHGYRPNPRLSRILTETVRSRYKKDGGLIYLIITRYTRKNWNSKNKCFVAMSNRCRELGYALEPFWIQGPNLTPERANQIMYSRGVDGLIIHPPPYSMREGSRLTIPVEWEKFCVVEIDDVITEPILHHVRHDHLSGIWLALQNMEELGYRRIGLCLSPEVDFATHHRWSAGFNYWAATRNLSESIRTPLLYDGNPQTLRSWILSQGLDAVIGPSDDIYKHILEIGLKVPHDIAFAALDIEAVEAEKTRKSVSKPKTSNGAPGLPVVAGILQSREEQYSLAVDMLVSLIARGARGVPTQSSTWIIGGKWHPSVTCPKRNEPEVPHQKWEAIPPGRRLPKAFQNEFQGNPN